MCQVEPTMAEGVRVDFVPDFAREFEEPVWWWRYR
jgi:hypothetical protein